MSEPADKDGTIRHLRAQLAEARNDALEEAAARANLDAKMYWENGLASASAALDNAAAAIRALKGPKP